MDTYRWRLPNTPGEHFHYTAVTPAQEKYLLDSLRANHYELVMKADAGIYERVAAQVLGQMEQLLGWFERINTMDDLRWWSERKDC